MQGQAANLDVMEIVVTASVTMIPGAEEASISLAQRGRRVVSAAVTSDVPRRFDDLQQQTRQGPCLDAMYEHETVRVDDLAGETRWPELARRADEVGMASMLCLQLFVEGDDLGVLNLMARRPAAFTDESERIGLMYASHAAVAIAQAGKVSHLGAALVNRDVIGQAKGVLMERYKITPDRAFALLTKVSQDTNRKLLEVAEYLTVTGVIATEAQREAARTSPPPVPRPDRQDRR